MAINYPNQSFQLDIERNFDPYEAKEWMRSHWHHSIYYSIAYVIAIHAFQHYMTSRPPFHLRSAMALWSTALAIFSIIGASRMVPHIFYVLSNHGIYPAICDSTFHYYIPTAYWSYSFAISKLYELGDTAFIVARKQKLTFLHWYHHITVFMYCWHGYAMDTPTGSPFGGMNYVVHSVMYTYYALKAFRINVPKQVNICITLLQLLQMVVGVVIVIAIYLRKKSGLPCSESDRVMYFAMAMYTSYLILFLNFFYQTYLRRGKKEKALNGVANGKHYQNGFSNGKKEM